MSPPKSVELGDGVEQGLAGNPGERHLANRVYPSHSVEAASLDPKTLGRSYSRS